MTRPIVVQSSYVPGMAAGAKQDEEALRRLQSQVKDAKEETKSFGTESAEAVEDLGHASTTTTASLVGLVKTMTALAAASGVALAIRDVVRATNEEHQAANSLRIALVEVAGVRAEMSETIREETESLERLTGVQSNLQDIEIARAIRHGASVQQAQEINRIALRAAQIGEDYQQVLDALTGSLSGSTRGLEKFVPELKDMTDEGLRAGGAIALVGAYMGELDSRLDTVPGKTGALAAGWEDLKAAFGNAVATLYGGGDQGQGGTIAALEDLNEILLIITETMNRIPDAPEWVKDVFRFGSAPGLLLQIGRERRTRREQTMDPTALLVGDEPGMGGPAGWGEPETARSRVDRELKQWSDAFKDATERGVRSGIRAAIVSDYDMQMMMTERITGARRATYREPTWFGRPIISEETKRWADRAQDDFALTETEKESLEAWEKAKNSTGLATEEVLRFGDTALSVMRQIRADGELTFGTLLDLIGEILKLVDRDKFGKVGDAFGIVGGIAGILFKSADEQVGGLATARDEFVAGRRG